MFIDDIIREEQVSKYYTFNDVYLSREWIWLEPPFLAVSVLTGEIRDIRSFKKNKL